MTALEDQIALRVRLSAAMSMGPRRRASVDSEKSDIGDDGEEQAAAMSRYIEENARLALKSKQYGRHLTLLAAAATAASPIKRGPESVGSSSSASKKAAQQRKKPAVAFSRRAETVPDLKTASGGAFVPRDASDNAGGGGGGSVAGGGGGGIVSTPLLRTPSESRLRVSRDATPGPAPTTPATLTLPRVRSASGASVAAAGGAPAPLPTAAHNRFEQEDVASSAMPLPLPPPQPAPPPVLQFPRVADVDAMLSFEGFCVRSSADELDMRSAGAGIFTVPKVLTPRVGGFETDDDAAPYGGGAASEAAARADAAPHGPTPRGQFGKVRAEQKADYFAMYRRREGVWPPASARAAQLAAYAETGLCPEPIGTVRRDPTIMNLSGFRIGDGYAGALGASAALLPPLRSLVLTDCRCVRACARACVRLCSRIRAHACARVHAFEFRQAGGGG
jgi:hypothetical protein